ncbi:hypothetical protein F4861DRAFT_375428 [Xylaria intraflava]|nr:hypothetical protein F4861DRAFT_375428 [Xylaria intraflava]
MASSLPPGLDLSTIPISPPPPGQQSNFINPPSTSWAGRLAVYLTLPFAVVAVILRIYVRVKNGQMGADDYLLLAAAAASFSFSGVCLVTFLNDVYGRHQWDIPLSELKQSLFQQDLTSTLLYTVSAPLIKVAILALCLRLFRPSHRATVFVWVGIVVIPIYYITLIVVFLYYFVPRPGDGGWGSPKANARSLYPSGITTFIQGVGGIISDFYVLAIPVFMVLKLNLPIRRRIGVSCIFLTGLV